MFALRIDDDVSLRLLEERHAPDLFALIDANRAHLSRWFDWIERTTEVEHTRDFLRRSLRKFADGNGFEAGIFVRGEHVGMLGLHYVRWEVGATELGYWLAAHRQGEGVMTRTVAGVCRLAFEEYGLQRVEIRTDPANTRSRRVPERLGFTKEGTLRRVRGTEGRRIDHVVYGLLVEEWRERMQTKA